MSAAWGIHWWARPAGGEAPIIGGSWRVSKGGAIAVRLGEWFDPAGKHGHRGELRRAEPQENALPRLSTESPIRSKHQATGERAATLTKRAIGTDQGSRSRNGSKINAYKALISTHTRSQNSTLSLCQTGRRMSRSVGSSHAGDEATAVPLMRAIIHRTGRCLPASFATADTSPGRPERGSCGQKSVAALLHVVAGCNDSRLHTMRACLLIIVPSPSS